MNEDPKSTKPRLLTGDRPTGQLHLGHLLGSLQTRVALQDSHESFIIVADLHTLTTRPQRTQIDELHRNVRAVVLDLLSVGIDPSKSTIYLQSGVPAVYDLAVLLGMLIPQASVEAVGSVRAMANAVGIADADVSFGLLGYPVLQTADILMARADVVPVGRDNEENVAIARQTATTFNEVYGAVFPIPQSRASRCPALPGVGLGRGGSGAKMSKSLGNAVFLSDEPSVVADKIRTLRHAAPTSASASASNRSALVEFVFAFIDEADEATAIERSLANGTLSETAVQDRLVHAIEDLLQPVRARRSDYASQAGLVEEVLVDGTIRAREVAYQTLQHVREAMGLEALWEGLVSPTRARAEARKRPY